jgi:hypothetical protein
MSTIKTIKLKKMSAAETQEAIPLPVENPAAPETPTPASAPLGLEPASSRPRVSGKSYLVYALMAIAATLFCAAIVGMQVKEHSFYKADPSVWPAN